MLMSSFRKLAHDFKHNTLTCSKELLNTELSNINYVKFCLFNNLHCAVKCLKLLNLLQQTTLHTQLHSEELYYQKRRQLFWHEPCALRMSSEP